MAGLFNKMMNAIGISAEEDEFEEFETLEPEKRQSFERKGKVVNINATTQFKVVVIQPESFEMARDVADNLKDRKPVVINLEKVDREVAHRIFDFLSGSTYALGGTIQKVTTNIFLIAPYNVTILGDFKDELKSKSFLWN